MIPFRINFRSGVPLYEQIVYAPEKAIVSRQLRPGDAFPSVRVLSRELKINPNTAHKVITQLIGSGLLETRPGIGTVVSELPEARSSERVRLLEYEIEQLVVEAKKLCIGLGEMIESVSEHWKDLSHHRSNRGGMAGDEPNNRYREPR